MTKREALAAFQETADRVPDKVAMRTAWNDFVDWLQKAGKVTTKQADTWVNPFDN